MGGAFEPLVQKNTRADLLEDPFLINTLQDLGYLDCESDPVVSGIAKFYHVNRLGPLTVWPAIYAYHQSTELLQAYSGRSWMRNPKNLMFALPRNAIPSANRKTLAKYGTRMCSAIIAGGG